MTDINLDQMRQDIDNIDEKLTDLFKERMEKSLEIAKYKKGHKVPVFSDKREKEILHKVSEQIGEPFDGYARLLFNTIFDASRSCQNNYMAKRSDLADRIEEALKETPNLFPKKAVVACQGVAGSYSQAACEKLFEVPSIMYFNSFEGVFNAVEKGLCQYGILPIENSSYGSVRLRPDAELQLPYRQRHPSAHQPQSDGKAGNCPLRCQGDLLPRTGARTVRRLPERTEGCESDCR